MAEIKINSLILLSLQVHDILSSGKYLEYLSSEKSIQEFHKQKRKNYMSFRYPKGYCGLIWRGFIKPISQLIFNCICIWFSFNLFLLMNAASAIIIFLVFTIGFIIFILPDIISEFQNYRRFDNYTSPFSTVRLLASIGGKFCPTLKYEDE